MSMSESQKKALIKNTTQNLQEKIICIDPESESNLDVDFKGEVAFINPFEIRDRGNQTPNSCYLGVSGQGMTFNLNKFKTSKENTNAITLGQIGQGSKSIIFKEAEFKKELAPKNAKIEHDQINGEKTVKMTYPV